MLNNKQQQLLTVTGIDRPGITGAIMRILDHYAVKITDIEQVVVHSQLTLCFLFNSINNIKELKKDLEQLASKIELDVRVSYLSDAQSVQKKQTEQYVVTLLGNPISTRALSLMASTLAVHGANIESIRRLSEEQLNSIEATISCGFPDSLKRELITSLACENIDVAVQREDLSRCNKRLVVLDMDSTLLNIEVIDELAKLYGVGDEVTRITHDAMTHGGEFSSSLRERVALLRGMPITLVNQLMQELPLTDGAELLVKILKHLGYRVAVISGGFTLAGDVLKKRLGLHHVFANELIIDGDFLAGFVKEPIIDAAAKAQLLKKIAMQEGIALEQTIAIGDGANDALMLSAAGLGIAFHAKQKLKDVADASVSSGGLERILYFLGLNGRDIDKFR